MEDAGRGIEPTQARTIAGRPEKSERQRALGNREDTVARSVQYGKSIGGRSTKDHKTNRGKRMRGGRQSSRCQRMEPPQKTELQDPRGHLGRADQRVEQRDQRDDHRIDVMAKQEGDEGRRQQYLDQQTAELLSRCP